MITIHTTVMSKGDAIWGQAARNELNELRVENTRLRYTLDACRDYFLENEGDPVWRPKLRRSVPGPEGSMLELIENEMSGDLPPYVKLKSINAELVGLVGDYVNLLEHIKENYLCQFHEQSVDVSLADAKAALSKARGTTDE